MSIFLVSISAAGETLVRLDLFDVPAGVNQDDEFVPQAGIAYSQVDLPK